MERPKFSARFRVIASALCLAYRAVKPGLARRASTRVQPSDAGRLGRFVPKVWPGLACLGLIKTSGVTL